MNTFMIQRIEGRWLYVTEDHKYVTLNTGIIIHDNCPYDYCQTDVSSLIFNLETPDDQCAFIRTGVLCRACQANLSQDLVFGTSRCKECSGELILAVIPATIIAGFPLVVLMMSLNLTDSTGTLNELIFYTNIIRASQALSFPPEIGSSFLSIFIAWLNLDLGIKTCFCDGLDAYAKTWLQFVFPLYIWLMVITIIVASHYSSTASKILGTMQFKCLPLCSFSHMLIYLIDMRESGSWMATLNSLQESIFLSSLHLC